MISTICRSVCARISSDNSGEDIFLPRSSSKITTSSGFSRRNIASDSSWIAPARSFDEFGRMDHLHREWRSQALTKTQNTWLYPGFVLLSDGQNGVFHRLIHGGERGIRTPDTLPHTRFRVVRLQPLGHLSSLSILLHMADVA